MKQTKIWILAVLACLGIILVNACGGSDSGCQTRNDCATGLICNIYPGSTEGVCEEPVLCTDDTQCQTGWECYKVSTTGWCVLSGSGQTSCTSDTDCNAATEYCNLNTGLCEEKGSTQTPCQVQADCDTTTQYCNFTTGYCEDLTTNDPCSPNNPCVALNKNVCASTNGGTSYTCSCNPGYVDDGAGNCVEQTTGDPCDPNPCQEANKAVCTASGTSYVCSCNEGYIDDGLGNCVEQTTEDPCDPNPCQEANKSVCTASGTGYVCSCNAGYTDDGMGNCVEQSTGDTTQAKVCDTIPANSFETPLTSFCVAIDDVTLQTAAEACGTCSAVPANVATTLTMSYCGGQEMGGGPLDALSTTEHYIFVLAPDAAGTSAELTILTISDLTQFTCADADYDSVVASLQQKGARIVDVWPLDIPLQ